MGCLHTDVKGCTLRLCTCFLCQVIHNHANYLITLSHTHTHTNVSYLTLNCDDTFDQVAIATENHYFHNHTYIIYYYIHINYLTIIVHNAD